MIGQKLNLLLHVHFLRVKIENRDWLTFLKVTVDSCGLSELLHRPLLTFRRVSKYVEASLEVLEDSSAQSAYRGGLSLVDFTLASAKRPCVVSLLYQCFVLWLTRGSSFPRTTVSRLRLRPSTVAHRCIRVLGFWNTIIISILGYFLI